MAVPQSSGAAEPDVAGAAETEAEATTGTGAEAEADGAALGGVVATLADADGAGAGGASGFVHATTARRSEDTTRSCESWTRQLTPNPRAGYARAHR